MQYKISVCVPIYNVEKYFEQCLDSLFTQTMLDGVEFIFVNDCTPDSSMTILQRTLQKYPALREQVVIYNHEQNRGLAAARNTALELSHGEYIIHVDSDDWVEPNYLEELYTTITENDADIAICNCYVQHKDGNKIASYQIFPEDEVFNNISYINSAFQYKITPVLWLKLVKRKLYQDNNIKWVIGINKGEDAITTLKLFYYASKIVWTPKQLYNYRYQVGFTQSLAQLKLINQDIMACNEIERFFKQTPVYDVLKKRIDIRKACIRLDYIFASPKFSIKKYRDCFADVPLSTIKLNGVPTNLFRSFFYWLVDCNLHYIANIYLLIYFFIKGK